MTTQRTATPHNCVYNNPSSASVTIDTVGLQSSMQPDPPRQHPGVLSSLNSPLENRLKGMLNRLWWFQTGFTAIALGTVAACFYALENDWPYADPDVYDSRAFRTTVFHYIMLIGELLGLWYVWTPLRVSCKGIKNYLRYRQLAAGSDFDASPFVGGGVSNGQVMSSHSRSSDSKDSRYGSTY